jgi:hypothetical protein
MKQIDIGPFLNVNRIFDVSLVLSKLGLRNFKTHYTFFLHFNGVNIRLKLEIERGTEDDGKKIESLFLFMTGMGVIGKAVRDCDKVLIGTAKYKLINLERYFQDILKDTDDEEDISEVE